MNHRLQYLLEQIEKQQASEAECEELLQLISADETGEITKFIDNFHAGSTAAQPLPDFQSTYWANGAQEVLAALKNQEPNPAETNIRRMSAYRKWSWAAAAAVLLTTGALYLFNNPKEVSKPANPQQPVAQQEVLPGKNGALLTLADGTQVVLDSLRDGVIATQQGSNAVLKNGALSYAGNDASGESRYNTLSTPRGRQFKLQLPDGSKVWLNAASSIRYPTAFAGNERKVEVTGEAYFEVASNATMPFRVNVSNRANIEVLGTSFNVNSYENENNISTTLIEGAVKVSVDGSNRSAILKPGQQASIQDGSNNLAVLNDVDTDKIIAWKNGYFNFGKATLPEVMRQLERWYDIETVYEKGIPDIRFVGKMTRNITLNELFQILDSTGVSFRIEGKKLIVTK